jgi:hypothetical protein
MQIKNRLIDIEMYNGRNMDIDTYQKKKKRKKRNMDIDMGW